MTETTGNQRVGLLIQEYPRAKKEEVGIQSVPASERLLAYLLQHLNYFHNQVMIFPLHFSIALPLIKMAP